MLMAMPSSAAPVVVGVDGSPAALEAARWAAAEAISRAVPLRLINVVDVEADLDPDLEEDPAEVARDWPETIGGLKALEVASAAVHDLGRPISLETQIIYGSVDSTLIEESARASLLCLGSTGIAPLCRRLLGSTAVTLAERGHCPIAVIRTASGATSPEPQWIVVAIHGGPDDDRIVDYALGEAHLRRSPVLALDVSRDGHGNGHSDDLRRRVSRWRTDHPYVQVYPVCAQTNVAGFLTEQDHLSVQLAVLGAADAGDLAAIVGSHRQTGRPNSGCSVLVVR